MVFIDRYTAANAELFFSGYRYLETNNADLYELEGIASKSHLTRPEFRHQMKVCMLAICQVGEDLCGTYHAWSLEPNAEFPYGNRALVAVRFSQEIRKRIQSWYSSKVRVLDKPFLVSFIRTVKDAHALRDMQLFPLRSFLLKCHERGLISLKGADDRKDWNT